MRLVRVGFSELGNTTGIDLSDRPPSALIEDGSVKSAATRTWLRSLDLARSRRATALAPPVWMYDTFKWGPHAWPVRWSDLLTMPRVDCGVMAAVSTEVYRARGLLAVPVQVILAFNPWATTGWRAMWRAAGLDPHWSHSNFAYHEVTGLVDGAGRLCVWDPLGRFWLSPVLTTMYETILAIRVHGDDPHRIVAFGEHMLRTGAWYQVEGLGEEDVHQSTTAGAWGRASARSRGGESRA